MEISEAIKLFGISDESEELILVHVATSHICNVQQKMEDIIEGDMVPMSVISESTSWIDVEKASIFRRRSIISSLYH